MKDPYSLLMWKYYVEHFSKRFDSFDKKGREKIFKIKISSDA